MYTHKKMQSSLVAIVLSLSAPVFAVPSVTFQGEVTDQTCAVSINGQLGSIVLMPTVSMSDFGSTLANGQSAGQTPFTVSVTGCKAPTSGGQSIRTTFLGYDVDVATGALGNRLTGPDAAKGFGIQLMDAGSAGSPIRLSGLTSVDGVKLAVGQTETSYDFGARYFVIDKTIATAGKITAVVEYTLSYL